MVIDVENRSERYLCPKLRQVLQSVLGVICKVAQSSAAQGNHGSKRSNAPETGWRMPHQRTAARVQELVADLGRPKGQLPCRPVLAFPITEILEILTDACERKALVVGLAAWHVVHSWLIQLQRSLSEQ